MVILSFLTIPWLGSKDIEPRAPSVPKARIACAIGSKGLARTFKLHAPSGPYITPSNGYIEYRYNPLAINEPDMEGDRVCEDNDEVKDSMILVQVEDNIRRKLGEAERDLYLPLY